MSLLSIMEAIQTLEAGLELDASIRADLGIPSGRVKQAFLVAPKTGENLHDLPCFINWPDAMLEQRMGPTREDDITVQVDFFAQNDGNKGPKIAIAFWDLMWRALDADRRLGGACDYMTVRSERPALETLEWNNLGYPGFHIFLDIVAFEVVS